MPAPASTIVTDFFTSVDAAFITYFSDAAGRVAGAVRGPFNILVTIYVLLWGIAMWRGLIREPMSDGVMRIMKIVLIGTFALNAGIYNTQIAETLYGTPEQLAAVLMPVASGPVRSALDRAIDAGLDVVITFKSAAAAASGFVEPLVLYIDSLFALLIVGVLVTYAAALILLAKIGLSIALGLGPFFISCLLFEPTRRLFSSWLNQALSSVFTFVVSSAIVALGITFFTVSAASVVASIGSNPPMFTELLKMLLVGGAVLIVLNQASAIASALSGGVQIGTMGAVGWAMARGKSALGAPLSAYNAARGWNDRRLSRDYYRTRLGATPTLTTRSMEWTRQRLRGVNSVVRDQ